MYIISQSNNKTLTHKAEESLNIRIGPAGPVEMGTPSEKIERLIDVSVEGHEVLSFKVNESDLEYWEAVLTGTSNCIITVHDFTMVLHEHLMKVVQDRKGVMSVPTLRHYLGHLVDGFEKDKKKDSRVKFGG